VLSRLPDLLERWPYAVAEKTEQIDGAACVVLDGNMECELPADGRVARKRISDRIWLDPKLGLAIRKRESRIGGQLVRAVNTDFAEVLPGFWLPKRSRTEAFAIPKSRIAKTSRPAVSLAESSPRAAKRPRARVCRRRAKPRLPRRRTRRATADRLRSGKMLKTLPHD
jgi:hypothetical protein